MSKGKEAENQGLWSSDEFEDRVSRAIVGLYETEDLLSKEKRGSGERLIPQLIPGSTDIEMARGIGCYFPPEDRVVLAEGVDIANDGLPTMASNSYSGKKKFNDGRAEGMLDMTFLWKIDCTPRGWHTSCVAPLAKYRMLTWIPQDTYGSIMHVCYIAFDHKGRAFVVMSPGQAKIIPVKDQKVMQFRAHSTIQLWADRRHMWNVEAIEHEAKATFGVYESQIKSLFYMRSAPVSETGRKRPILHWVRSHVRRLGEGIDIDVERYLRGCNTFEMNGTTFRISRPTKTTS